MTTLEEQLRDLRARIGLLKSEQQIVWQQARSRNEVCSEVRKKVAGWYANFERRSRLHLRQLAAGHMSVPLLRGDVYYDEVNLAEVLAGVVGPERIEAALLRHIDAEVPPGLDSAARSQRLFEIAAELDALEAEEEALIEASERTGAPLERRPDARPDVVLGVRDPVPPRVSALYMGDKSGEWFERVTAIPKGIG
jgi:hypothetical protein